MVYLWSLLWVVTPPPIYEHSVGTRRTVKKKEPSQEEDKKPTGIHNENSKI